MTFVFFVQAGQDRGGGASIYIIQSCVRTGAHGGEAANDALSTGGGSANQSSPDEVDFVLG